MSEIYSRTKKEIAPVHIDGNNLKNKGYNKCYNFIIAFIHCNLITKTLNEY